MQIEAGATATDPGKAAIIKLWQRRIAAASAILVTASFSSTVWAQAVIDQIPRPSGTLVSKEGVFWFGMFNLGLMATAFAIMFWVAWRNRSVVPLFFLLGGALGGLVQPVFDGNIHVQFAMQEQPPNWYFYNVGYPWFVIPGNAMLGAPAYFMYTRFRDGISVRGLWLAFIGWWMFNNTWEVPGTWIGSYAYFGPHPYKLAGYPLWVGMMAGLGIPLAGYAAYGIRNALEGPTQWISIAAVIPVAIYGSEVTAWPMWLALNGGASVQTSQWVAGLALVMVLIAYNVMVQIYRKSREGAKA